jgi:photosystem II stability/assembly factor-like uncharacterized protein
MVDIPPEIKNVIEQQEASLQRIAMWIVGIPGENRTAAINLARKVFEETFQQASLDPELAVLDDAATAPEVRTPALSISRGGGAPSAIGGEATRLLAGTRDTLYLHDGISWTPLKTFEHAQRLRELHINGSRIFIIAEGVGLFCSDDAGLTWRQLGAEIIAYPATLGVLRKAVLVANSEGQLFRSTDRAEKWNVANTIPVLAIGAAGERAYLISRDGSIACSTDQGQTFTVVATIALPKRCKWATFAVSPSDQDHVWLGTSDGAFKSTNGGRSWEAVPAGLFDPCHVNAFAIAKNAVYAAMSRGVFRYNRD